MGPWHARDALRELLHHHGVAVTDNRRSWHNAWDCGSPSNGTIRSRPLLRRGPPKAGHGRRRQWLGSGQRQPTGADKLDDLLFYASTQVPVTALVARDRRLLRLLALPSAATTGGWRDAAVARPWLATQD